MVIKIPQCHDFPQSLKDAIFNQMECSLPQWEIFVTQNHNLAWSIVLSYLMTTNKKNRKDFPRRLKSLTGSNENEKLVKKSIQNFNPFRNRFACFHDEILKLVVDNFRKHLEWDKLSQISEKLLSASRALKCPILLIHDYVKSINYQIFKLDEKITKTFIVLIASSIKDFDNPMVAATSYNFMIDGTFAQIMKKAALQYYLKETDMPKKAIKMLKHIISEEETFIKAVLKSKYKRTILDVYKFPYVVSRLAEAGYEIDPRAKDSEEFTGLYYALALKDSEILNKLYFFAVDNCCQTEASFRNPDPNILLNLRYIEELLHYDLSQWKNSNFYHEHPDIETKFDELLKLNSFLIEINKRVLEIKNRQNYYETMPDIIFGAINRKDVILTILDTYKEFFKFGEYPTLDDYICHKDYYLSVDLVTAIFFFDNITFLKERLKLENDKQFSDIESSFFFSIVYNLNLEKPEFIDFIKDTTYYSPKHVCAFSLMYRIDHFHDIINFSKLLHDITIDKENVVHCIPESEIHSIFHSHAMIKNVFGMARLVNYIQICKNIRVTNIKSVLVIERILQVIGECITSVEDDGFYFKRLLYLCLPKNVSQTLRHVRNELTHLKGHAFPSKFKCEENMSLFRSILREILEINNYIRIVNSIIVLSYYAHLFGQFESELQKVKRFRGFFPPSFVFATALTEKLTYNSERMNIIRRTFLNRVRSNCYNFFKMALINLEFQITKQYLRLNNNNVEDIKNKIIILLSPLKWFLELLKECQMLSASMSLNTLYKLESIDFDSLDSLKKLVDNFLIECYDLLPKFNPMPKKIMTKPIKPLYYIECFRKNLKFYLLSKDQTDEIRKEIPEKMKKQVLMRNTLLQDIERGFNLQIDVNSEEFELSYLSKKKMKELKIKYENKDPSALEILKSQDPISELEEIFTKNSVDKKKYDKLCEIMQFSEKVKRILGKLVAGQNKKVPANNLQNLLQRIQLLKQIIIDEDDEIHGLWSNTEEDQTQHLIDEKIVRRYLKDYQFQVAIEMLLFDCMILFEGVKLPESLRTKSSKLYQGINMRNIMSHGHPLVENLCLTLDPKELPSEVIRKSITLIKGEDAIKAILELHDCVNNDFTELHKVINSNDHDNYCELRCRIKRCNEWSNYTLLLPDRHKKSII